MRHLALALVVLMCGCQSVRLFDGRSLRGWTTEGGRYDGQASWRVEDGAIVGRTGPGGRGGLIYTEKRYESFELELEVWIDFPFDSGVFLRMLPRSEADLKGIQVTLDYREGGEIGAIYADGFLEHNEAGWDRFLGSDWNHLRIRCTGMLRVEVWVNGALVTDYSLPRGTEGFAAEGLIGLQVHSAPGDEGLVRFRNIRLKPL